MKFQAFLVLCSLLSGLCLASPIGLANLERLATQASVVVVASVESGTVGSTQAIVVLNVSRVLKGSIDGNGMRVRIPGATGSALRDVRGVNGIWFLSRNVAGDYDLLPTIVGTAPLEMQILPAALDLSASWKSLATTTILESVIVELANALEPGSKVPAGLAESFLTQAMENLSIGSSQLQISLLRSSADSIRNAAIAGLIRGGDLRGIQELDGLLAIQKLPANVASSVCVFENAAPEALSILDRWVRSLNEAPGQKELRRCAAYALRVAHVASSVPTFLFMLDASDEAVRYEGIAGLAALANAGRFLGERPLKINGKVVSRQSSSLSDERTRAEFPTLETFRKDPQRYLSFWKHWAQALLSR